MSKFKSKRQSLGEPPPIEEASANLEAPEVAPTVLAPPRPTGHTPSSTKPRRDGRTLRKTHRTLAFATRVSPEFDERLRDIAERDGLMLVELLEKAIEAYELLQDSSKHAKS